MKLNSAVSGDVHAVVSSEQYNFFDDASFMSGTLFKASVSGDSATVTINNNPQETVPSAAFSTLKESAASSQNDSENKKNYKIAFHFVQNVLAYITVDSAHFSLNYPPVCDRTVMEQWIGFAEEAYDKLIGGGSTGGLNFDPEGLPSRMELTVKTLPSKDEDRSGEAGYGMVLWGTTSLNIGLNCAYCKDASANSTMRVTIGHEFFHTLQYAYDPSWVLTQTLGSVSTYTSSPFAWFYDTSSAWFEGEMLGNPSYFGSLYKGTETFYQFGLETGGPAEPKKHGYGSSLFLRYLTAKYGSPKVLSIWEAIKLGGMNNPTDAMIKSYIPLSSEWRAFAEPFLSGKTKFTDWPVPLSEISHSFYPDMSNWEKTYSVFPLSARKIALNFPNDFPGPKDLLVKAAVTDGSFNIIAMIYEGTTTNFTKLADVPATGYTLKAMPGKGYTLIIINDQDLNPTKNVKISVMFPLQITSLNPSSGKVGDTVTIGGQGFGANQLTSTVTFNGTVASASSWSDTSIVVTVPTGATTGDVVVTVNGVTSNGFKFTIGSGSGCDCKCDFDYSMSEIFDAKLAYGVYAHYYIYQNNYHGPFCAWWDSDRKIINETVCYKNGKWHGLRKLWYKNGQQQAENTFSNGIGVGIAYDWNEDGTCRSIYDADKNIYLKCP